jgi:ribosomal protein S18 acetylase RimI-like enzyme
MLVSSLSLRPPFPPLLPPFVPSPPPLPVEPGAIGALVVIGGIVSQALVHLTRSSNGGTVERLSAIPSISDRKRALQDVSEFFIDAFWTSKVSLPTTARAAKTLTDRQERELYQSQSSEFQKRYFNSNRQAELLIFRSSTKKKTNGIQSRAAATQMNIYDGLSDSLDKEIAACVGVEVERIPTGSLRGPIVDTAPLMSNLAVSRSYRRQGLARRLVREVERMVQEDWGYSVCYLYVERQNQGAIKLYRKLGYSPLWTDASASTLVPTVDGQLVSQATIIVCMQKQLPRR